MTEIGSKGQGSTFIKDHIYKSGSGPGEISSRWTDIKRHQQLEDIQEFEPTPYCC